MNDLISFLGAERTKVGVTVISTVVGIVLTIAKIKSLLSRRRSHLKEDIEIRNSLDKKEEEYKIVAEYVKERIRNVYGVKPNQNKTSSRGGTARILVGAMLALSGIYLTYAIHESVNWSGWWYIGTIYLTILGVYMSAFGNFKERTEQSTNNDTKGKDSED